MDLGTSTAESSSKAFGHVLRVPRPSVGDLNLSGLVHRYLSGKSSFRRQLP